MAIVAVVGASGGVGHEAVKQLLASGQNVRAVVRNPERLRDKLGATAKDDNLQIVKVLLQGDVQDQERLRVALKGVSGIIDAAAGTSDHSVAGVDWHCSGNVAAVARELDAHVVLISSCCVTERHSCNAHLLSCFDAYAKLKGEELLRRSGAAYTIIRPGHLINGPAGERVLKFGQGDKGEPGCVSRADVAAVAIVALNNPGASTRKAIELASHPAAAYEANAPQQNPFEGAAEDL